MKLFKNIGKGISKAFNYINGHKTTIGSTLTSIVLIADGVWDLKPTLMTGLLGLSGVIFGGGVLHKVDKKTNVINKTIEKLKKKQDE